MRHAVLLLYALAAAIFAAVHADLLPNVSSDVSDTCNKTSLAYFMVKTYQGTAFYDEFVAACNNKSSDFLFKNATVLTKQLAYVDSLADKTEAEYRRLAIPSFPKCGVLYACPPGPCSVYDVHFQSKGSIDTSLPQFQFESQGMCGPAFGVQGLKRKTNTLVPPIVDTATSESMPSLYEDGVLVFDPASPSTAGYVPALGNIVNKNPYWYYTTVPAWETDSNNKNSINQKNCYSYPNVDGLSSHNVSQRPYKIPEYAINDKTPAYGDFNSYIQDGNGYSDPDFTDVYPQTISFNITDNVSEFVDAQLARFQTTCDLSQCSWLPVARPMSIKDKISNNIKQTRVEIYKTLNCINIELARAWLQSEKNYVLPTSCFNSSYTINSTTMQHYYKFYNVSSKNNYYWTTLLEGKGSYNTLPDFQCTTKRNRYRISDMAHHFLNELEDKDSSAATQRRFSAALMYECFAKNLSHNLFQQCIKKDRATLGNKKDDGLYFSRGANFATESTQDKIGYGMLLAYYYYYDDTGFVFSNMTVQDGYFAASDPYTSQTEQYEPVQAAVGGYPPLVPNTYMTQNASILNDFKKSESAACNCNNEPIIYAWLDLPWFGLPQAYNDSNVVEKPGPADGAYSATLLRESSYSWASDAAGDSRDGLPIGLYVPSNKRHGRNFVIRERNFLTADTTPGATLLNQTLADAYFLKPASPSEDVLQNQLLYNVANYSADNKSQYPYAHRTLTFEYGACMKPPYGQVSSFELDAATFAARFNNSCNSDFTECTVREASLMGYCDKIKSTADASPMYPYCFDDPLTYAQRETLCSSNIAQNIVLAQVLGVRAPSNVCNSESKTCLIIPEEPDHSLSAVLTSSEYNVGDNYTILITPFNWTIATAFTSQQRYYYPTSNISDIYTIPSNDTTWLNMQAVLDTDFKLLYNQSAGPKATIKAIDAVCAVVNTSFSNQTSTYTIPYLSTMDFPFTTDFVYPRHNIAQIPVMHNNIVIRSAATGMPIKVQPAPTVTNGNTPCTFLYVGAKNMTLNHTTFDMTNCYEGTAGIDAAAIVFGGSDVSHSSITIDYASDANIRTPVIFAGDDTMHFAKSQSVTANNVLLNMQQLSAESRVSLPDSVSSDYDAGAARTVGSIYINMTHNNSKYIKVIQQMQRNKTLVWQSVRKDANISFLDVSKYTNVFGDNVLQLVFPENKNRKHLSTVIFTLSLIIIVFVMGQFAFALLHRTESNTITPEIVAGTNIAATMSAFGPVLHDTKQQQRWIVSSLVRRRRNAVSADVNKVMEYAREVSAGET